MNESSPELSPTMAPSNKEPYDSVQSVEIQGVTSDNANRTLSDLFSTNTTASGDVEGHNFFDSIFAPSATDPFAEVAQQNLQSMTEVPAMTTEEPPSEGQPTQEPTPPPLEPLELNTQEASDTESQFLQSEGHVPPLAPLPSQINQGFAHPANVVSNTDHSTPRPNLLDVNISQTTKPPSAPPTPEGECVKRKQTEAERRHSAWICNPQTKQFLVTIGSGMLNPADVGQQFLTSPGLVIESPQVLYLHSQGCH